MKKLAAGLLAFILLVSAVPAASAAQTDLFPLSEGEQMLIARFCTEKAPGEALIVYIALSAVLLNRLADPRYPDTVSGLVGTAGFAGAQANGDDLALARWAVRCAQLGMDPTDGALHFARAGTADAGKMEIQLQADGWCFGT